MNLPYIIGIVLLSLFLGIVFLNLGGLILPAGAEPTVLPIVGFLLPSVCLIADMHSNPDRNKKKK